MNASTGIAFLSPKSIESAALAFLLRTHPSLSTPIPIERIVEHEGLDIVPIPGLRKTQEIDGFLSLDERTIYVDDELADRYSRRYRFTLAHELSHLLLHHDCLLRIRHRIASLDAYREFLLALPDDERSWFELQAHQCAGVLLVPPSALSSRLDGILPEIAARSQRAFQTVPDASGVWQYAWEGLLVRLRDVFDVSTQVIERRLKHVGLTADNLKDRLC